MLNFNNNFHDLQNQVREKEEKLRRVKQVLKDDVYPSVASSTTSVTNITSKSDGGTAPSSSVLLKTPGADSRRVWSLMFCLFL